MRGSFPAPHHHDPNEMLPNFAFWVMVAAPSCRFSRYRGQCTARSSSSRSHRALEATPQPSCSFLFVILLRLATPALRLGVLAVSWQRSESFVLQRWSSMPLRTQVRPAIEFVSGKEGLRPRIAVFVSRYFCLRVLVFLEFRLLGHPEVRKGPWPLRRPRRDGNGGRFVRSPCLPSWCGLRLLHAVHQMLSLSGPCTAMVQ